MPGRSFGLRLRSWLTFLTGLVECICFAGAVFGWPSLVFVLKSDGYFQQLCVNTTVNGTYTTDCSSQDKQFSLIFTIASFMNNFLTLPNGFLFDRFGTAVTRLLGISLYTAGTLLIAFSSAVQSVWIFPALSLIAVGGILFLVTNMQVGNLFGFRRSTVITLYNGAFDSSAAIFLIIKLLYEGGISMRASFLFLSACSVIHLLRTALLMPRSHIPYPVPEGYTYGMKCGDSGSLRHKSSNQNPIQDPALSEETSLKNKAPLAQILPEKSFWSCVLSRFFLFHLLWISVIQLRHYLFIGTLNPMLIRLTEGDPTLVSRFTNAFAFTQLCGVLCAPWNGLIMDRHKKRPTQPGISEQEADLQAAVLSLVVTVLQCVFFSVCAATPFLPLQYLTFVLQVLNRSFLYGGNAAFINIAFPAAHFGKIYGLVMALSAVVSLLQYPCFDLVKGHLGGDPLYVNIALTVLSSLAFIHPLNVYLHCRRQASQKSDSRTSAISYN
ncbi:solute carrier family 43 member 3b [Denticeps clupeoides]|uniref:Solute carrier family 43 member 3 n=1 Tax=Denticeps clupeoides TaxID=299321 RepID=A0AAY4D7V6_9TELE|nr:solute carrier family 43 member 3-like [Denticeps clupeoides]XP_028816145.1 solute carrier family 43 member 3-like [Denticeps clupeoides]